MIDCKNFGELMAFAKRIVLFLVINFLVMLTIFFVVRIFNIQPYLSQYGISYLQLLIFCLIWGMGGAMISLALSRVMAKWMVGVKLIDEKTKDPELRALYQTVEALAQKARLPEVPQVGIYDSPELNAFATGPTKRRSLVAVSTGLLNKMTKEQVEGVLAHEITHVSNGDMVTMALLQGVVNAFVMFLARILAFVVSGFGREGEKRSSHTSFVLFTFLFEMVFMLLGTMVVCWFSRFREFRADSGGAELAGKKKMISGLEALKAFMERRDPATDMPSLETLKISTPQKRGLAHLFSTHPPLEDRIARLREMA